MGWKNVVLSISAIFLVALLFFYWIFPLETINFGSFSSRNSNFSIGNYVNTSMQFYENMRYPGKDISYRIQGCPLSKSDEMKNSFEIIQNLTVLSFYPVSSNEEILVTCDSQAKFQGDLFIAGEGGPINITKAGNFNVIRKGAITLIRESKCENPNVGTHELLHTLGFDHSENPNNIMYPVSKCSQTIGQDIIDTINQLYSFPSLPDLAFENVSATMDGRYLNMNFTVRNEGLKDSQEAKIQVYADGELVKEIKTEPLDIGSGRRIWMTNLFILQRSVDELKFVINANFQELDKKNNEVVLNYKN